MKKLSSIVVAALCACVLALCVGCSSGNGSASADAASSSAEASAASTDTAVAGTPADPAAMTDGEYQIELSLEGGSGKAFLESPARITVSEGQMTLIAVWSSEFYDLMIVDGQELYPVPRPGNSTFEVPIATVQEDLSIQAETTAMSEPHMIDYVIHFDTSTLVQTA